MGSPMPKKMKLCVAALVVLGVIVGALSLLFLAYSTHKLVHAVEHQAKWNETINDDTFTCDVTNECCACERAEYGHCCEKRVLADETIQRCLAAQCQPRMSYHWCHYVIVIASLIILAFLVTVAVLALLSLCLEKPKSILSILCNPCLRKCINDGKEQAAEEELQDLKKEVEEAEKEEQK